MRACRRSPDCVEGHVAQRRDTNANNARDKADNYSSTSPRPVQTNPESVGLLPNHWVGPTGTVSMLYTSVVPAGPDAPARPQTQEEAEATREQWRQELRQKDEYKEMFAKEDKWREGSKALKAGMTLKEV